MLFLIFRKVYKSSALDINSINCLKSLRKSLRKSKINYEEDILT
ncbi:hypothetical protein CNEO4_80153 [Clostridium neonatale]|nr:hypothetical protein CNEO4_80153 [Clostridium neonatale]